MPARRFDGYPINSFLLIIKQYSIFRRRRTPTVDLYDAATRHRSVKRVPKRDYTRSTSGSIICLSSMSISKDISLRFENLVQQRYCPIIPFSRKQKKILFVKQWNPLANYTIGYNVDIRNETRIK